jgi:hypothetical protein
MYLNGLRKTWEELQQSNVVLKQTNDPESLNQLADILNTVPIDVGVFSLVNYLRVTRYGNFYRFVKQNRLEHLLIVAGGNMLVRELEIQHIVNIFYHKTSGQFRVRLPRVYNVKPRAKPQKNIIDSTAPISWADDNE